MRHTNGHRTLRHRGASSPLLARALAGVVALAAISAGAPTPARADGDATTESVPRVIPYHGYLERHGAALSGTVALRFTVYDSDGAAAWSEERSDGADRSCAAADACLVNVTDGAFTVWLGEHAAIEDDLLAGVALTLEVSVRDDDGTWLPLGGRQTLQPVAYALWSAGSDGVAVDADVAIDGETTVDGTLEAVTGIAVRQSGDPLDGAGDVEAGAATVVGAVTVESLAAASLTTTAGTAAIQTGGDLTVGGGDVTLAGYRVLTHESSDRLGIGSATGADVTVEGTLTLTNGARAGGDLTVTSGIRGTHWTISADRKLLYTKYFNLGESENLDTDISTTNWICWVGGFRFLNGDICEDPESDCLSSDDNELGVIRAFTYPRGADGWYVHASFLTHLNDENKEVQVVCAQRDAFDVYCPGTGSTGWYPDDCPSARPWFDAGTSYPWE